MSARDFYVYEHIRSDTGAVFYVGKGRGRRAWRLAERNQMHRRVVAKLARDGGSVEVRFVRTELPEPCALTLERLRIAALRAANVRLVNLTDGGEGSTGYKPTTETLRLMAEVQRGKKRTAETKALLSAAATGRRHTDETKRKLSEARAKQTFSEETRAKLSRAHSTPEARARLAKVHEKLRGRKHTEEAKHLMSERLRARWAAPDREERAQQIRERMSKPVRCIDTGDVYPSAAQAAKATGASKSGVCVTCQGKRKKTNGLRFEYA